MKLEHKTKRLILRLPRASDYGAWASAHQAMNSARNQWDVLANGRGDKAEFTKIIKRAIARAKADLSYKFFIFLRSDGTLIGSISAQDVVRGVSQSANLGYAIFNHNWGQGYAKEALIGFFALAFKDLKLHRLEAGIEPRNRRSIMLARSIGMRREGLKKRAVYLRGAWQDLTIYGITSEEVGRP